MTDRSATRSPFEFDPETDLELRREVAVAPEAIWRAWTAPELLVRWFTPRPYETIAAEVDLRPGGIFRTVMRSPEGEESDGAGCVLEAVPGERFVWTSALGPGFRPVVSDLPFTAVIEVAPTPSGGASYRALVRHADTAGRQLHAEMGFEPGWGAALDQLVELMSS